jgi:hypothetical protein
MGRRFSVVGAMAPSGLVKFVNVNDRAEQPSSLSSRFKTTGLAVIAVNKMQALAEEEKKAAPVLVRRRKSRKQSYDDVTSDSSAERRAKQEEQF